MSVRGVAQLQRLQVFYCRHSGSSRGVRDFLRTQFEGYASAHPQLAIESVVKPGQHPVLVGTYKNGISKHVAVKNEDAASVHARAEFLRMQAGRKARPFYPIVHAEKQSVQGFWTPELLKALVAEQK